MVAGAPKLDLFIETTVTAAGGGHPATLRADAPEGKRWQFNPAQGMRFTVVGPSPRAAAPAAT